MTTSDVTFTRYAVTDFKATNFLTNRDHFTHVFVANNHRYWNGFL